MNRSIDATHGPALRSWIESANAGGVDFPIQNLPFGVFRRSGGETSWGVGVAIGDQVLSLGDLASRACSLDWMTTSCWPVRPRISRR